MGFLSLYNRQVSLSGVLAQPHNRVTTLKVFVCVRVVCGHLVHHGIPQGLITELYSSSVRPSLVFLQDGGGH